MAPFSPSFSSHAMPVPPATSASEGPSSRGSPGGDTELCELIRRDVARCGLQTRVHSYTADAAVFSQGSKSNAVYFVEQGLVKVTRGERDGSVLIVGLRRRGQILGLPSVLLGQPYTTGVHALTRCVFQVVPAAEFLAAVHENGELAWHVLQFQSRKACERLERIAWFGSLSARDRLMRFLWELASTKESADWTGDVKIPARLKFWEIAQAIGVTPPYLTRLFNELERASLIRRDKGWVILTKEKAAAQEEKCLPIEGRPGKVTVLNRPTF